MAIGMFATTLTSVISNTTINQTSNSKININVDNQSFAIGSSYSNYYTEIFDITAHTGIRSWIDFTNQYHYFGWSGDNPLGNNWYYASIVSQCQRDGVKKSTLQLSTIPQRNGIPLDDSTYMESRDYAGSGSNWEEASSTIATSFSALYYGGYYYQDNGDLIFGVSVNVQEQHTLLQQITAAYYFNLGQYASFWS